jgi:hypothetical protein
MQDFQWDLFWPWLSLFVGLVARIVVPWLAVRQSNPQEANWSWRFVWPMVVSFVLVFLVLPLVIADLTVVSTLPYQAAWLMGWGAADLGRKSYKALAEESDG